MSSQFGTVKFGTYLLRKRKLSERGVRCLAKTTASGVKRPMQPSHLQYSEVLDDDAMFD